MPRDIAFIMVWVSSIKKISQAANDSRVVHVLLSTDSTEFYRVSGP